MSNAKQYNVVGGTSFHKDTPIGLCNLLNDLRETRTNIRVFLGDTKTGRCWNEEYDVIGRVGRSTGTAKIPLLVPRNAIGGPALLDNCILRIQETYTKAVLYQHPKFVMPEFIIVPTLQAEKYKAEVYHDNAVIARFETVKKAENWVAFMRGERMKK